MQQYGVTADGVVRADTWAILTGTHHKSTKYRDPHTGQPASMPHYVIFAAEVGFHAGSLSKESHGCVHLSASDAQTFYSHLNVGDEVSVIP